MLTIVIGPPAAGKSTWVQEHARHGDIVIDYDRLAVALTGQGGDPHDHPPVVTGITKIVRNAAIEAALKRTDITDVYIIHSSPNPERLRQYQARGAKVVTIDPGRDVVRQRCKTERPRRMLGVVDGWYRNQIDERNIEQPRQPSRTVSSSPVFSFPASSITSREW